MCFLTGDTDDDVTYDNAATLDPNSPSNTSKRRGSKRWQFHKHHTWIIPRKPLLLVLAMAIFILIMGVLFMAIGGGIGSIALKVVGGLLLGFGLIGLIICMLVCVHAYFFYGTRDQCTQTTETPWSEDITDSTGYASVGRPSALKSPDSTLKRNGTLGVKKVTLAPELGTYGELQPSNTNNNNSNKSNINTINAVKNNSQPLHRLPSTSSANGNTSRAGSMPRTGYVDGSTVGTGGIKITPLDSNQPFPSPASSVSYGGSAGQYYSTGGGGSSVSGSTSDTYAYPKSVLGFDANNSGSQYSTLRSIPVTHIGTGSDRQKQPSSYNEAEYATVNKTIHKPGGNTMVRVEHVPVQHNSLSPPPQGLIAHVQMGQDKNASLSQRMVQNEDDRYKDYDNTVEHMPMISSEHQQGSNKSYHEKQMQFQRHQRMPMQQQQQHQNQHQQDLHAPRQINSYSLQRQYAQNPFTFQQIQQQQQEDQEHRIQQYKIHYEQEKKQQQQQFQSQMNKSSAASSARNSMVDDVFEPQPLVYPSARRPMTFEQVSSSKISVYDNVLANNLKESDELEG